MTFRPAGHTVEPGLQDLTERLRRFHMESKKTFGEYIRERRRAMGLTQREFAEKLYVTEFAVSKWERGDELPGRDTAPGHLRRAGGHRA